MAKRASDDRVVVSKYVVMKGLEAWISTLEAGGLSEDEWTERLRSGRSRLAAELAEDGSEPA